MARRLPGGVGLLIMNPGKRKSCSHCELQRGLASHCKDKPFEIGNDEGRFSKELINEELIN
jgi:hypothetical protein